MFLQVTSQHAFLSSSQRLINSLIKYKKKKNRSNCRPASLGWAELHKSPLGFTGGKSCVGIPREAIRAFWLAVSTLPRINTRAPSDPPNSNSSLPAPLPDSFFLGAGSPSESSTTTARSGRPHNNQEYRAGPVGRLRLPVAGELLRSVAEEHERPIAGVLCRGGCYHPTASAPPSRRRGACRAVVEKSYFMIMSLFLGLIQ